MAITYLRANSALDPDGRYVTEHGEEAARAYAVAMAAAFVLESILVGFLVCLCRCRRAYLGHRTNKALLCAQLHTSYVAHVAVKDAQAMAHESPITFSRTAIHLVGAERNEDAATVLIPVCGCMCSQRSADNIMYNDVSPSPARTRGSHHSQPRAPAHGRKASGSGAAARVRGLALRTDVELGTLTSGYVSHESLSDSDDSDFGAPNTAGSFSSRVGLRTASGHSIGVTAIPRHPSLTSGSVARQHGQPSPQPTSRHSSFRSADRHGSVRSVDRHSRMPASARGSMQSMDSSRDTQGLFNDAPEPLVINSSVRSMGSRHTSMRSEQPLSPDDMNSVRFAQDASVRDDGSTARLGSAAGSVGQSSPRRVLLGRDSPRSHRSRGSAASRRRAAARASARSSSLRARRDDGAVPASDRRQTIDWGDVGGGTRSGQQASSSPGVRFGSAASFQAGEASASVVRNGSNMFGGNG